jgi:hypothetical protein
VSDEKSPSVMAIEAHEELIQRIESGQTRIRALSIVTVVVAFLLAASYFSQIVLAFVGGQSVQTVDLLNPGLIALEVALLVLSAAWLYVGVVNYLFASRLGRQVTEIRAAERELEGRMGSKARQREGGPERSATDAAPGNAPGAG